MKITIYKAYCEDKLSLSEKYFLTKRKAMAFFNEELQIATVLGFKIEREFLPGKTGFFVYKDNEIIKSVWVDEEELIL